jgi:hypothetical protein
MIIGYKKAFVPEINLSVIVTLELPMYARHNIFRKTNNAEKSYGKYRCSCCMVLEIRHAESGSKFPRAVSLYDKHKLEYIVGRMVICPDYDEDEEAICSYGIHFFLSYYRAKLYKSPFHENHFQMWFDNGITRYYGEAIGKCIHGMFLEYDSKGRITRQFNVENNIVVSATICSWNLTHRHPQGLFEKIQYRRNPMIWDVVPVLRKLIA